MAIHSTAPADAATALAERLTGEVIAPDHPAYDTTRRVWNGMIDKRPAAIARCAHAGDVATAVRFAADHGLPLAVRGGGHNVAGTAVVNDGLVVDLSAMREVRVDGSGRTVHVQGGATWADVDRVTAPLGLATPGGVVSETGVAGLALSGGVSNQRRRDGMTVDNLVAADVVLADGRQVRASAAEHPDLHWALRGGGGNFGVVTSFTYRLHAVGPGCSPARCCGRSTTLRRSWASTATSPPPPPWRSPRSSPSVGSRPCLPCRPSCTAGRCA